MEQDTFYSNQTTNSREERFDAPSLHTINDFYKNTWEFLKGKWLMSVLTSLVASVITGIVGGIFGAILYVFLFIGIFGAAATGASFEEPESAMLTSFFIIFIVAFLVSFIFMFLAKLFVFGPINYGLQNAFLISLRDNKEANIENIFLAKNNYIGTVKITGWSVLFIFLWSLLFIIPGIIKAYSYAMIYYIRRDYPELTANECLKLSSQMMDGHKLDLFILHITFIGLSLLGLCTGGISNFFAAPFIASIMAQFYEDVKAKYEYYQSAFK